VDNISALERSILLFLSILACVRFSFCLRFKSMLKEMQRHLLGDLSGYLAYLASMLKVDMFLLKLRSFDEVEY
jgi:hypothetical protein